MDTIWTRCAVCGAEGPVAQPFLRRNRQTGESEPDDGRQPLRFADGVIAASCAHHSPDESRTALVLHGLVAS